MTIETLEDRISHFIQDCLKEKNPSHRQMTSGIMVLLSDLHKEQRQSHISAAKVYQERINALQEVLRLKDEYIKLLGDEIGDMCGMMYVHGWISQRVEAGEKLRSEIETAFNNYYKTIDNG